MPKHVLRKHIYAVRDSLTPEEISAKSRAVAGQLEKLPFYREAGVIMFFMNFRSEVETGEMVKSSLARGIRVIIPKMVPKKRELIPSELLDYEKDLTRGYFGVPEPQPEALRPVDPRQIDLLIVPGVAFDLQGNRLGYGGGYYDRFFERLCPGAPLVAPTFELQLVEQVPVEAWDRRMDWLVTERRAIHTAG